jgi:ribonuclease Y
MVTTIIVGLVAILAGGAGSYFLWEVMLQSKSRNLLKEAEVQSEIIKEKKAIQAKEKFIQLKADHDLYINDRNQRIIGAENKLKQREAIHLQRKEELQRKIKESEVAKQESDTLRENLNIQLELIEQKNEELERMHKKQIDQLEAMSGISAEEAKTQLIDSLKNEAKSEAMSYIQEIMDEAKMNAIYSAGSF